jgi:hypothetical protein
MTKPNAKCPCGTGLKYKKCCSKKDRNKKSKVYLDPTTATGANPTNVYSDDPTTWKHYGERHSSNRFFIGQRVECCRGQDFLPGTVTKFNFMEDGMTEPAAYQILLDVEHWSKRGDKLVMAEHDSLNLIRPLGFTKTNTCSLCGVPGAPESPITVKLSKCSACNRAQYCSETCQRADWNKHKPICKLLTEDKKRMHDDAKKQARETKTPQELTEMLIQAVNESNKSMVKRLLKMKAGSFDINQRGKHGRGPGNTPLTMSVGVYYHEQNKDDGYSDLSIVKRLLKVNGIDVNKHDLSMGGTPLWHACQKGLTLGIPIDDNHDELVELLRSVGAKYERHKVAYDAKLHMNR